MASWNLRKRRWPAAASRDPGWDAMRLADRRDLPEVSHPAEPSKVVWLAPHAVSTFASGPRSAQLAATRRETASSYHGHLVDNEQTHFAEPLHQSVQGLRHAELLVAHVEGCHACVGATHNFASAPERLHGRRRRTRGVGLSRACCAQHTNRNGAGVTVPNTGPCTTRAHCTTRSCTARCVTSKSATSVGAEGSAVAACRKVRWICRSESVGIWGSNASAVKSVSAPFTVTLTSACASARTSMSSESNMSSMSSWSKKAASLLCSCHATVFTWRFSAKSASISLARAPYSYVALSSGSRDAGAFTAIRRRSTNCAFTPLEDNLSACNAPRNICTL